MLIAEDDGSKGKGVFAPEVNSIFPRESGIVTL